jgi:hypothetical protein
MLFDILTHVETLQLLLSPNKSLQGTKAIHKYPTICFSLLCWAETKTIARQITFLRSVSALAQGPSFGVQAGTLGLKATLFGASPQACYRQPHLEWQFSGCCGFSSP